MGVDNIKMDLREIGWDEKLNPFFHFPIHGKILWYVI
jgi:hypothetical protein